MALTLGAENVGSEKVDLDHDCSALTVATHEVGLAEGALEAAAESGMEPEAEWLLLEWAMGTRDARRADLFWSCR